jgi:hypothetical protein
MQATPLLFESARRKTISHGNAYRKRTGLPHGRMRPLRSCQAALAAWCVTPHDLSECKIEEEDRLAYHSRTEDSAQALGLSATVVHGLQRISPRRGHKAG